MQIVRNDSFPNSADGSRHIDAEKNDDFISQKSFYRNGWTGWATASKLGIKTDALTPEMNLMQN